MNKFNNFSEALSFALSSKDLEQSEFAEILGTHETQVSRWVTGKVLPFKKTLEKMNISLNISISNDYSDDKWQVTPLPSDPTPVATIELMMQGIKRNIERMEEKGR